MRYKFYREHKYVCAAINDVERLIATTDFTSEKETAKVNASFLSLSSMLKSHANYENSRLHQLLKDKYSKVHQKTEGEHKAYETTLDELAQRLKKIMISNNSDERIELGYQFYLWFRKFAGDNLLHLHEEETVILPELQQLYTDEELSKVEFLSYQQMSPEQLIDMMKILFPHINKHDRLVFLTDINACDRGKFITAWEAVKNYFDFNERENIEKHLSLKD